jgi:hypothetical protein
MIAELVTWLTTDCAPQARKLGYLYEAIAMKERVKRCAASWNSHCEQAQAFATHCIQQQEKGGVALIFGSGLGVDLPKETLLAQFDEIWLVDMVHLRETKKNWAKDSRVHFIEHDVTESLADMVNGKMDQVTPQRWLDDKRIRFVLSANILGQLPVQPLAWLAKQPNTMDDDLLNNWTEGLLQAHLAYLDAFKQQSATVCLIADLEWRYSENNKLVQLVDAWRGLAHEAPDASWEWRIAPRGELHGNRTQTNWVGGWCW